MMAILGRPLFCPICDLVMRTADDASAYGRHSCCAACVMHHVEPNRLAWEQGWRPAPADVARVIEARRILPLRITIP